MSRGVTAFVSTNASQLIIMLIAKKLFACVALACTSLAIVGVFLLFFLGVDAYKVVFGKWFLIEVLVVGVVWYPFVNRRMS